MATAVGVASPVLPLIKRGFRADIQGLRAVAVLMVVLYHSAPALIPGGYLGVDVFFVISGFLITSHLLEKLQIDGRISVRTFYARRAVRILPAALTVVVLTAVASLVWMPPLQHADALLWAAAAAAYIPNVLAWTRDTDYLAETAPSAFQQFWSLGIEEQFYLLWPVFLALGWVIFGRSQRALLILVCVTTVASFTACLVTMDFSQPRAFFSLPTRGWELGVGGIVAFLLNSAPSVPSKVRSGYFAWAGLFMLALAALTYDTHTPYPGVHAVLPVISTALLLLGGCGAPGPGRLLSAPPLQFIGLISYSLYLVHWPLLVIPQSAVGYAHPLPLSMTLSLAVLAIPTAYLLYRFVENPIRRAQSLNQVRPMRILLVAVASSALIVIAATLANSSVQAGRLDSGRSFPPAPLDVFPSSPSYVPSNLTPELRDGAGDLPLVMKNGCDRLTADVEISNCQLTKNEEAPVVVLFGDSHAAQWHPALHALAEQGLIQLQSNVKGDCPSVAFPTQEAPAFEALCQEWRAEVIEQLQTKPPDIILISNYAGNYLDSAHTASVHEWARGLARTIGELPENSRVGVIADVPNMGESPAICLSAHLREARSCEVPRLIALDARVVIAEQEVATAGGATYLDFTDYLCGPSACPPVIGNLLTHRDGDHLTATFGRALAEPFMRELQPLME